MSEETTKFKCRYIKILKVISLIIFLIILILIYTSIRLLIMFDKKPIRAPFPIYKTKMFMPDAIKDTYIGMPIEAFEKLNLPILINKNKDPLFYFTYKDYPDAKLVFQQKVIGSFNNYFFKFIYSGKGWTSLGSIEASTIIGDATEYSRLKNIDNYINEISYQTKVKPQKGVWMGDKQFNKEMYLSFIWRNSYSVIVLSTSSKSESLRWAIYDSDIFDLCLGKYLCDEQYCKGSNSGWLKNKSKMRSIFGNAEIGKMNGIDKYEWFIDKRISCRK